jgi:hypothetical protein
MFDSPILHQEPGSIEQYIPSPTGERDMHIGNPQTVNTLMALGHLPGKPDPNFVIQGPLEIYVIPR